VTHKQGYVAMNSLQSREVVKKTTWELGLHRFDNSCDRLCENPPNCLLFQNEIEARKVDAIITVVGNNYLKKSPAFSIFW